VQGASDFKALAKCRCNDLTQYDLRVVFVHDGLFGRKQFYSYVKDKGVWWKTVDNEVTEVRFCSSSCPSCSSFYQASEETVLTDRTGVHLGAGPYMLLYSRALTPDDQTEYESKKIEWPELLRVCRALAAVCCTISDALSRTRSNTTTMYSCLPCDQRFESDSNRMIANLPLASKLYLA
jgi:predicted SprT family Zn-dependent metalloprotease